MGEIVSWLAGSLVELAVGVDAGKSVLSIEHVVSSKNTGIMAVI